MIKLPLVGEFQIENALVAAGLAIGTGSEPAAVFATLEHLEGAKGRLERVGEHNGAPIFVDYAHKPDALAKALQALRPYAKRKLVVIFGAGGDRDAGKRPMMGAIAAENADSVIVTDDNPRSENPETIRAAILAAAKGAERYRRSRRSDQGRDIGAAAGRCAVDRRQRPRDRPDRRRQDAAVQRSRGGGGRARSEGCMSATPLWTIAEVARALGLAGRISGYADRFRHAGQPPGEAGMPVRGAERHAERRLHLQFRQRARRLGIRRQGEAAGAVAMIVPHRIEGVSVPQLVVKDTLIDGLWTLARAARARFNGPVIGLTGSAGKTSTKEFLAAYPGAYASPSSFNNFWGVPLTLCNASPERDAVGRRNGHEPDRRNRAAQRIDGADGRAGGERAAGASGKARQPGSDPAREGEHRARPAEGTACWCCRPMSRRRNGTARSFASATRPRCGS